MQSFCYIFTLAGIILLAWNFEKIREYLGTIKNDLIAQPGLKRSFIYIDNKLAEQNFQTRTDTIDFLRVFVHDNSVHILTEPPKKYAWTTGRMINWMVKHDRGQTNDKPHLSCGPRTAAFAVILGHYSIPNRVVHTYSDEFQRIKSHTLLEVWDSAWHMQDAEYNVYFADRSGKRAGMFELVFIDNPSAYTPIGPDSSGWKSTGTQILLNNYFESMRVNDVVLINNARFDQQKRFPRNGNISAIEYFKERKLEYVEIEDRNPNNLSHDKEKI